MSRSLVARIECGHAERVQLDVLLRVAAALDARLSVRVFWRGEALDRLRDERHAALVEAIMQQLIDLGWRARAEVTFSSYGERGSVDVLAYHSANRALLVVEVKSVVPDLQSMLAGIDRKARLAPSTAHGFGWGASTASRLLVLPDRRTSRRRLAVYDATFAAVLPARTVAVKRRLRRPQGLMARVIFLPDVHVRDERRR